MTLVKMGGYKICCQVEVEESIDFRPKKRKRSVGEDFISPSTIGAASPAGLIAGASAMKIFTLTLS